MTDDARRRAQPADLLESHGLGSPDRAAVYRRRSRPAAAGGASPLAASPAGPYRRVRPEYQAAAAPRANWAAGSAAWPPRRTSWRPWAIAAVLVLGSGSLIASGSAGGGQERDGGSSRALEADATSTRDTATTVASPTRGAPDEVAATHVTTAGTASTTAIVLAEGGDSDAAPSGSPGPGEAVPAADSNLGPSAATASSAPPTSSPAPMPTTEPWVTPSTAPTPPTTDAPTATTDPSDAPATTAPPTPPSATSTPPAPPPPATIAPPPTLPPPPTTIRPTPPPTTSPPPATTQPPPPTTPPPLLPILDCDILLDPLGCLGL